MSTAKTEPTVRPKLGPTGKPIRRGRWTFVSHQWNGDVWRLDGSDWDLEFDPLDTSQFRRGGWTLYIRGRYAENVAHYLDCAMEYAEKEFDRALWKALGGEDIEPAAAYL